jgi:hypothetical protein
MTDHRLKAETGQLRAHRIPSHLDRDSRSGNLAVLRLHLRGCLDARMALVDEIPEVHWRWRIAAKVLSFVGLAYFMLINIRVRNWLARLLLVFKDERR